MPSIDPYQYHYLPSARISGQFQKPKVQGETENFSSFDKTKMISQRWCRIKRCSKVVIVITVLLLTAMIMHLHFYFLPDIHGAYNQECYLSKEKLKDLLHAVQTIGKTLEKHKITYWLDYGTLLGAIRYGDIIPWDGDGDIGFLLDDEKPAFHEELTKLHGIKSIWLVARYKQFRIDYARWKKKNGTYDGKQQTLITQYFPDWEKKPKIVQYKILGDNIPLSWVVPTKKVNFGGAMLSIPNSPHKVLANRYSFSYVSGLSVQYKWKCWVPCWIRTAPGC